MPGAVYLAAVIILAAAILFVAVTQCKKDRTVTYSLYPYLPEAGYYSEVLEEEWSKLHPDVTLEHMPYNCYSDGRPEGIDVVMYDVLLEKEFVEKDYLKPLDVHDLIDTEDFYGFTLEPADGYQDNYGVPVFLCCDLMIYDRNDSELNKAENIFDVAGSDSSILISFAMYGYDIYLLDAAADKTQDPVATQYKDRLKDIDVSANRKALANAAVPEYRDADSGDFAGLYDSGAAGGYIGYAETMRSLSARLDRTEIKQISMDEQDNVPLYYCDMAGISADVPEDQIGLCMDLIRIMTDREVMERASVKDGRPQYLMSPRISFYDDMEKEYPMYAKLKDIVANENNRLFRAYGSFMDDTNRR